MTTLVTGGAGFIGSHLCDFLINKDHHVICVDNCITGRKENLSSIWNNQRFSYIEHDITTPFNLDEKIDYVIHLASPASPKQYLTYPLMTIKAGGIGTYHMLEFTKKHHARFLLASSSEVYGDPKQHPQTEAYWGNVNPIGLRSVYDEAKRYAEAITMLYHRNYQLETRISRIFNTYGPHMRMDDGRAIPTFITQALQNKTITVYGDGSQTRSFCYISDLIEGIYRLLMSNYVFPINLGNPNEMNILQVAQLIKNLCHSNSDIQFFDLPQNDPIRRKPDITQAIELLNWKPQIHVSTGLQKVIDFYQKKSKNEYQQIPFIKEGKML